MNQLRSLTISHLGPLLINHLGNKPHQYLIAQCVWYGACNIMLLIITVGFCILHDVLYDMGIMTSSIIVYWQCQFYCQDNGLLMAQLCAMI